MQSWRFAGSLPRGWTNLAPAFLQRDNGETTVFGLYVRSPMSTQEDLLSSPSVELPAGKYDLVTSGRALVAGFQIGVRAPNDATIATSGYSSLYAWNFQEQAMSLRFTLPAPTKVHAVVSSCSPFPDAAALVLWKMKLFPARK